MCSLGFCRNDYVDGGINYISTPENRNKKPEDVKKDEILAKFTLNEFLDSFAIYDEKVSHYVSPVKTTTEGVKAERKIILIDFCNSSQELN
ncbi:2OG-Fe dioxygenase family protein [Photobacterium leiognathi]|uniref:2OG-Fe dioxygenase family protein n=1 Tax=Photobacterium leiognathi TaxID=553611 RepID=UPI0034E97450